MAPRKSASTPAAKKAAAKKAAPLGTTSPEAIASGNPAAALFAAAAAAGGGNPAAAARMASGGSAGQFSSQIPRAQAQRLEIRIDGRVRYANAVYEPTIDEVDGQIVITGDLNPTWVEPPKLNPPTRFVERDDVRNGEEVIQRVHTGRRDIYEAEE